MPVTAIVGAQWGDEGKGKFTHMLARESDVVARFGGGCNAGHTIVEARGRFVLHMLPSGVLHAHVLNVLGPGTALDLAAFGRELDELAARGVEPPRLLVSDRAQVVMPYHVLFDRLEEERLGALRFGSTLSGIAPFYGDKALKLGVQVADLFDRQRLLGRLEAALASKNLLLQTLYGQRALDPEALVGPLCAAAERVRPYVGDATEALHEALCRGQRILIEGQLGALRDPDHGIYPWSTSCSTLAGAAAVGAGLPPHAIDGIVAVTKAYASCVGSGPFVSEIDGEAASQLRERGGEYGATTGRPRRIGWFDAVATRHGVRAQGATEVALTMLDVLCELEIVPVCVAYDVGGERVERFGTTLTLERARPIYELLSGWREPIASVREYASLPLAARRYIERIEQLIGAPVRRVSVGPEPDATIVRP